MCDDGYGAFLTLGIPGVWCEIFPLMHRTETVGAARSFKCN